MPPLPRLRSPVLIELERQLRFAPAEALRRHLERVETLASEIDPARSYPEDWVAFRVTGYRSSTPTSVTPGVTPKGAVGEMSSALARSARPKPSTARRPDAPTPSVAPSSPPLITGPVLLADISALAERLSDAAGLTWSEARDHDQALDADDLCARWKISRKTLERCRRAGLPARRVAVDKGLSKLAFLPAVVKHFEKTHAPRLNRAASFTRIDDRTREAMLRRAARYRRRFNCSLNQVARRLADRYDRSHEAVRQLLMREEAKSAGSVPASPDRPSFDRRPPLRERQRRIILRAWRRGIDASDLASRFRLSRGAVNRALVVERARLLTTLLDSSLVDIPGSPIFERPDARDVLLSPPAARTNLIFHPPTDLLAWVEAARIRPAVPARDEQQRITAYHFLRARSARLIRDLDPHHPSGSAIDDVETSLRWAVLLKALLIRSQLALLVETFEGRFARPLEELRSADLLILIRASLAELSEVADHHDPSKGGRLAAPAGLALNRLAARWLKDGPAAFSVPVTGRVFETGRGSSSLTAHPSSLNPSSRTPSGIHRATPRLRPGVLIPDWTRSIATWQSWLDPDPRIRALCIREPGHTAEPPIEPQFISVLTARYGWGGSPPLTHTQLAELLKLPLVHAARLERRAIRAALAAARSSVEARA